jgi:hypothetical protein
MSCFGFLGAQLAHAAGPAASGEAAQPWQAAASAVRDVALEDGGVLLGQVVDSQAVPQVGVDVRLMSQGKLVAAAKTGANGRFEMRGLSGGVYQLQAAAGGGVFRLWAPGTAPPSAQSAAMVVSGVDVARGQANRPVLRFLTNPWVLGGIVAAAIVVPLTVDHHEAS